MIRIMLLLVIMLLPLSSIQAQDDAACPTGLSDEDCELVNSAIVNMAAVESFYLDDVIVQFNVLQGNSGLSLLGEGGSGPVIINEDGTQADLQFDQFVVNGNGYTQIRLLNDMLYVNDGEAWIGRPLEEDSAGFEAALDLSEVVPLLMDYREAVTWTNITAEAADRPDLHTDLTYFEIQITPSLILASEDTLSILLSQMSTEGAADENGLSPEFFVSILGSLLEQVGAQLDSGTSEVYFGLTADHMLADIGITLAYDIDLSFLGPLGGELLQGATTFSLDLIVAAEMSQHNTGFIVEAPQNFEEGNPFTFSEWFFDAVMQGESVPRTPTGSDIDGELVADTPVTGKLSESNPVDTYQFAASAGDIVTITLQAADPNGDLDTYLFLYSEGGELLSENDDAEANPALGFFDSEIKSFEIPADGTYLVEATWLIESPDGDYILMLSFE